VGAERSEISVGAVLLRRLGVQTLVEWSVVADARWVRGRVRVRAAPDTCTVPRSAAPARTRDDQADEV
jgi:hypothetical protein